MSGINITMIGQSGLRWPVHDGLSGFGRRPGICLTAGGVKGLQDAPIETEWTEDTDGAVFSGERFLPRDLTLGFAFAEEFEGTRIAGDLESQFRQEFSARPDRWDPDFRHTVIEVRSEKSGARRLSVQLRDAPEMEMERDPYSRQVFQIAYQLRAGQPLWESDKDITGWGTSAGSGSGEIEVSNPTDVPMRHTWVLTPGDWLLPDPSWSGPKGKRVPAGEHAGRVVPVSVEVSDGGARITRERRKLHARTFTGANLLGRMGGMWVRFDIPPYTPPTMLPISVTGAPAGGTRAELHQPRLWSRPVGLEMW